MKADMTIVGGGVVAAATALAAARHKLSLRHIVPAAAAPVAAAESNRRRHYALSRGSVNFLRALQVELDLHPVMRFRLHAGSHPLTLQDGNKDGSRPLCYMAAETQLLPALRQALDIAGVAATACEQLAWQRSEEDCVALQIDGNEHRTALLAVADGARSPLAAQLGIYGAAHDFAQQAIVAEVHTDAIAAHCAAQWFEDNDIVALLPMGDGVFSLVWSTAATPPPHEVGARLRQRIGIDALSIVEDSVHTFPLRAATRAARVAPRTALLGDAAGVIHPLAGQGLNLGLADAETFIQCLHRRIDKHTALGLAAYSWARSRRHAQMQRITKFLLPSAKRTAIVLNAARLPLLKRAAIAFANA